MAANEQKEGTVFDKGEHNPTVDTEKTIEDQQEQVSHEGLSASLVRIATLTGKVDLDNSGSNTFLWASPVTKNPRDEEGNPIPANKVGSIMIYGAPESLMVGGVNGDGAGQFHTFYLKPRTVEGLFDYVAPSEAEKMAEEMGLDLNDLPEPALTVSRSAQRKVDRRSASARGTAGRRLHTALSAKSAGARAQAALSLQTGAGSAGTSDPSVQAALELLKEAQQG